MVYGFMNFYIVLISVNVLDCLFQTPNRSGRPPFDHFDSSRWLQVSASCNKRDFVIIFCILGMILLYVNICGPSGTKEIRRFLRG